MTRLSVNLNKVALLRNARTLGIPSVVRMGEIALDAGAGGLTVHPRPDQRHIRPHDVHDLARLAKARNVEYNIEGNPFENLLDYARELRPQQCTLVPVRPGEITSQAGWHDGPEADRLPGVIAALKADGIRVSVFVEPTAEGIALAAAVGADRVELYTEPYARAHEHGEAAAAVSFAQFTTSETLAVPGETVSPLSACCTVTENELDKLPIEALIV